MNESKIKQQQWKLTPHSYQMQHETLLIVNLL